MKAYEHPDIKSIPLSQMMHALSDPCRVTIMKALLAKEELACNELPVEVAKATLSHHVSVLRKAGLIRTRVEGTKCLNTVRIGKINNHFSGLIEMLRHCD